MVIMTGISGPSDADTAVIGVCGLPRITKCRRIEFAAKMIALKCMNKQELAGGTYKMIDDDLTVLVYHASMG